MCATGRTITLVLLSAAMCAGGPIGDSLLRRAQRRLVARSVVEPARTCLIVAVDRTSSIGPRPIQYERDILRALVLREVDFRSGMYGLRIGIVSYDNRVRTDLRPTADRRKLLQAIAYMPHTPEEQRGDIAGAIDRAAELIDAARCEESAVLLLTDGGETAYSASGRTPAEAAERLKRGRSVCIVAGAVGGQRAREAAQLQRVIGCSPSAIRPVPPPVFCEDLSPLCQWAAGRECDYDRWLRTACPLTCGTCGWTGIVPPVPYGARRRKRRSPARCDDMVVGIRTWLVLGRNVPAFVDRLQWAFVHTGC